MSKREIHSEIKTPLCAKKEPKFGKKFHTVNWKKIKRGMKMNQINEKKCEEINLNVFKATRSSNGEIPKKSIEIMDIEQIYTIKDHSDWWID